MLPPQGDAQRLRVVYVLRLRVVYVLRPVFRHHALYLYRPTAGKEEDPVKRIYCKHGGYCDGKGQHYACWLILRDMAG